MIYTTGDTPFVSNVRARALRLGYRFNEFGLWRFHPDEGSAPPPEVAEEEEVEEEHMTFSDSD